MSQELTERVQHIKVAKMASVANTFPWVLASCKYNTKYPLIHRKPQTHVWPFLMCFAHRVNDLADDGVVSGRDGVEDPLDAFELLLIAGGDPVESFIIILQSSAALTAGHRKQILVTYCVFPDLQSLTRSRCVSLTCQQGQPPPCISSSSVWGSPFPPSPPSRSEPPLMSLLVSAEPWTTRTSWGTEELFPKTLKTTSFTDDH